MTVAAQSARKPLGAAQNATNTSPQFQAIKRVEAYLNQRIVGQSGLITRLMITLLCDGHLLVEGAPGLAKTTAIKVLAGCIEGDYHRVQFTPDLLPADLTGTEIYRPQDGTFHFQPGPIFHNVLLADEINRAPAKVQSALLEAMGERQVTIGRETYRLPDLFLVMATQNPIEQEGTYPLPEAQLDRFLLYVRVGYPSGQSEKTILQLAREEARLGTTGSHLVSPPAEARLNQHNIFEARQAVLQVHMAPALEEYLVKLVMATRNPKPYSQELGRWLRFGASPRATIALDRTARAHAWLQGRDFVAPEDLHAMAHDVLRHRILLTFDAEAEGADTDRFISKLLQLVAVP